jgi:hypothetical protein
MHGRTCKEEETVLSQHNSLCSRRSMPCIKFKGLSTRGSAVIDLAGLETQGQ